MTKDYYLFFTYATHYSYDVHGNVTSLLQDNPAVASIGQRFKRMDYDYDLISDNLNDIHYQNGQADAFHHHYEYDADNRLTQVYTSRFPTAQWAGYKDQFWDNDANLYYYKHGHLARVEIGDNQLQGIDYAYTIQGDIKGINSDALQPAYDMGKDGLYASANPNKTFAKDAFGFSLTYFQGDYDAIYNGWKTDSAGRFTASQYLSSHVPSDLPNYRYNLYNGHIGTMVSSITNPGINTSMPLASSYRYDQLNRIVQAQSFQELQGVTNNWNNENSTNSSLSHAYQNNFSYDANGNILSQLKKDINGTSIDSLIYNYAHDSNNELFQNRLYSVNNGITANKFTNEVNDQGIFHDTLANINSDNNYSYDEIGELKKDSSEQIQSIIWTTYHKIKSINRYPGSTKQNLVFDYDAHDNRIAKHIYTSANVWLSTIYYVRDAQGNIMSTYEEKSNGSSLSYRLKERDIYGHLSRLGVVTDSVQMIGAMSDTVNYCRVLGQKEFELTNHLGNVISVVSDRKVAQDPTAPLSLYNSPNLVRTTIDSLGGMKMQPLAQNGGVNFAFKSVIGQNYQVDFYVNLANTNSGDILQFAYPSSSSNSLSSTGHYTYNFSATDTLSSIMPYYGATGSTPNHYFLFDSLKIVATGTTLDSIKAYNAQIVNISDYYAFGAPLPGRQYSIASQYRYGFNGKENDNEVKGVGNQQDYGARAYDPRLGKFLSIDPITGEYPELTPYQFASNSPIAGIDRDGEEFQLLTGLLSAAVDYGSQVISNYNDPDVKNPWTDNINLTTIGTAFVEGALTEGGNLIKTAIIKTTVAVVNNTISVKTNKNGTGTTVKVETNVKTIVKNAATDIAVDAVVSKAAKGTGKVTEKVLKKANVNPGTIAKTTKDAVKAVGGKVTSKLNTTIKKASKVAVKGTTEKAAETTLKGKVAKKVDEHKEESTKKYSHERVVAHF